METVQQSEVLESSLEVMPGMEKIAFSASSLKVTTPSDMKTASMTSTSFESTSLEVTHDVDRESESTAFCDPVSAVDAIEQIYHNTSSLGRVEEELDTFPSRCVPKYFTGTAEKEPDSQILEDRLECVRKSCSSSDSEESERCSYQESELACIHGMQNRYQDAPMPLPIEEENYRHSFLVL